MLMTLFKIYNLHHAYFKCRPFAYFFRNLELSLQFHFLDMSKYHIAKQLPPGALIGFRSLLAELPPIWADLWSIKRINLRYPSPFGLSVQTLEQLSDDLEMGFVISNSEFQRFVSCDDYQVMDGEFTGFSEYCFAKPILTIECVDASFYELSVVSEEYSKKLEEIGIKPVS